MPKMASEFDEGTPIDASQNVGAMNNDCWRYYINFK